MKTLPSSRRSLVALGLSSMLVACGGGSDAPPADPTDTYRKQTLAWEACDPTILGEPVPYFDELGDRARCANMRVPLDHADPSKGEAVVALLRVSARKPEQRRGAIFFNPGGPGGDGLKFAPLYGAAWSKSDPIAARELLNQLADRYDLVGFSPRGVGASTNLYCSSNEQLKFEGILSELTEQSIEAILHNAKLTASACKKNPLTKYINTDQTARDMDLARELLGDKKLSYIGYSYGTWLGAWYASLFPERVDRMLLDSSMNVTSNFDEATLTQIMARNRILDEVLAPYAARHQDVFDLGTTAEQVRAVFPSLNKELRFHLTNELAGTSYKSDNSDQSLRLLSVANKLNWLLQQPGVNADTVFDAIARHDFYPDQPDRNAKMKADLRNLAYMYRNLTPPLPPFRGAVVLRPSDAVFEAVRCNDTAVQADPQYWIDKGHEFARRYPLGGATAARRGCLYWGEPTAVKPSLEGAAKAPGILIVQSQYDGATATEGAMATWKSLPNARMILINGEYSHVVFPYNTACVDERVARYFVDGSLPEDGITVCDGKPLHLDAPPSLKVARKSSLGAPTNAASPSSEKIIDEIHDYIHKANRRPSLWPLQ